MFAQRNTYAVTFAPSATASNIVTPLADAISVALFVSTGLTITGGGTAVTVQICNASSGETGGTAFYDFVTGVKTLQGLASTNGLQIQKGTAVTFDNFGFQQLRLTSTGAVTAGLTSYAVVTLSTQYAVVV